MGGSSMHAAKCTHLALDDAVAVAGAGRRARGVVPRRHTVRPAVAPKKQKTKKRN